MTTVLAPPSLPPAATDPAEAVGGRRARREWSDRVLTAAFVVVLAALALIVWPTTLGGRTSVTVISGSSMEPTYHTGDLALVRRTDTIGPGDVIVYRVPAGEPGEGRHVIHRVTGGDAATGWTTRGDNRDTPDIWRPGDADVVGTVVALVPQGGTWVLRALSPAGLGAVVAALAAWVLWPRSDEAGADDGEGNGTPENG
jgi:signal peptidase